MYGGYMPHFPNSVNRTHLDELHKLIREFTGMPATFQPTVLACSECPGRKEDRLPITLRTASIDVFAWFGRHKKCSDAMERRKK